MQYMSVFLDIAKYGDFWRENTYVSREYHVIKQIFSFSLGKLHGCCQISSLQDMCDRF